MKLFKDIKRYTDYSGKPAIIMLLTQQGLWALFQYRFFNWIYTSTLPKILKSPLLGIGVCHQKAVEVLTGITLPYSAQIGEGLYIGHHSGIIINAGAIIGKNCNISQGVTIGVSGKGNYRGAPVIGNEVYIGANATLAGKIFIGNKVMVGANSLVVRDVSDGVTVLGVPAVEISKNDSSAYI
ncbi:serine O-acetyltransferase [Nonlabens sp.]|uniref:serine O-acetyltransferase n=1 Tax=Nonlabens sp. TaxID=1888209 RepID=UPI001BD017DE|nr:serine acetyltransferase [Nonlabens sp.]